MQIYSNEGYVLRSTSLNVTYTFSNIPSLNDLEKFVFIIID